MCSESFDFLSLPSVFDATRILNNTPCQFFIEAFAGSAVFTIAVMMNGIPCFCPWEISIDARLDVVRNMHHLLFAIQVGLIAAMHLGTPCTSFTRARIPQLRSTRQPMGPSGLPTSMQALVDHGNTWPWYPVNCVLPCWKTRLSSRWKILSTVSYGCSRRSSMCSICQEWRQCF